MPQTINTNNVSNGYNKTIPKDQASMLNRQPKNDTGSGLSTPGNFATLQESTEAYGMAVNDANNFSDVITTLTTELNAGTLTDNNKKRIGATISELMAEQFAANKIATNAKLAINQLTYANIQQNNAYAAVPLTSAQTQLLQSFKESRTNINNLLQ